ncbi:sugar phosphate isomerase [Xylogone sp. PMI_703]|nr:sugar phosphate isomerase [Xylogone sp. PMI_703]
MNFEPTIASVSLGSPAIHPIAERLSAAAQNGFKNIEIVEADILEQAKALGVDRLEGGQVQAARSIRTLCDALHLKVCVIQPFWFYEGLLDRTEHLAKIEKLRLWLELAAVLGAQIIQIPTNWLSKGTTGDIDIIVQDLVEVAEMGLQQDPIMSFAYEGVSWGTHIDTWQGTWDIVKRVNKSNFGLCLDTFHIAGRVWADPTSVSGVNQDADKALDDSLDEMVRDLDVGKIFYVQSGDAERLDQPLIQGHVLYNEDQRPRMSWSRNARLFAYEQDRGGYLPVEKIIETIVVKMGYKGLVSAEMFSRHLFDPKTEVPAEFAYRGAQSYQRMVGRLEELARRS